MFLFTLVLASSLIPSQVPDEQEWQDTIRFKEEGQRSSILKRFEFSVSCLRGVVTPDPWNTSVGNTIWQSSKGQVNGLGQAQLKLVLDLTLIKISCIKLMTRHFKTFNGIEK